MYVKTILKVKLPCESHSAKPHLWLAVGRGQLSLSKTPVDSRALSQAQNSGEFRFQELSPEEIKQFKPLPRTRDTSHTAGGKLHS